MLHVTIAFIVLTDSLTLKPVAQSLKLPKSGLGPNWLTAVNMISPLAWSPPSVRSYYSRQCRNVDKEKHYDGGLTLMGNMKQNNTRRPSAHHSTERQLLIASGGPRLVSQQKRWAAKRVLISGSVSECLEGFACVCVGWICHIWVLLLLYESVAGWGLGLRRLNVIYWCVENNQLNTVLHYDLFAFLQHQSKSGTEEYKCMSVKLKSSLRQNPCFKLSGCQTQHVCLGINMLIFFVKTLTLSWQCWVCESHLGHAIPVFPRQS